MREKLVLLLLFAAAISFYVGYVATPSQHGQVDSKPISFSNTLSIPLIAVTTDGEGVLAEMEVVAKEGTGKFFIGGSSNPLVNSDTQGSLKTAFNLARNYSSRQNVDVFYSFSTDSEAVGGRSASAAASVATIAALQGKKLNPSKIMTGAIEEDGLISQVGKVLEKAKAIKKDGRFTTFIVPTGEARQSVLVEECTEKQSQNSVYRQCVTKPKVVDIANETGLIIIEAGSLGQAYALMTS